MGSSTSKHEQLTEILSNVMMSTMSEQAISASSNSSNTFDMTIVGSDNVSFKNNTISQLNNVDLSAMATASSNAKMQSQLNNDLMSAVTQQLSTFPQIGDTNTEVDIKNIIKNNIQASFSTSNMASINATTTNTAKIMIGASTGVDVSGNRIEQQNVALMRLVNNTANDMASEMLGTTKASSTTDQSTKSVVTEVGDAYKGVFDSLGGTASNVVDTVGDTTKSVVDTVGKTIVGVTDSVTSMFGGWMMMIVLLVAVAAFIGYKFYSGTLGNIGDLFKDLIGV